VVKMCDVKHCKQKDNELIYYDKEICRKHWIEHCEGKINLKKEFNIKEKQKGLKQWGI